MKILINQNECAIFIEVAEHMDIELDAPKLLYEIEDKRLVAVAIALGGIQFIETVPQPAPATLAIAEPAMDEHRSPVIIHAVPGSGKKKPLHLSEMVAKKPLHLSEMVAKKPLHLSEMVAKKADPCVICGGPIIGRGPRALTCSDSCSEELKHRRLMEKQMGKLSTRVKTSILDDEPSDQELEELEELDQLDELEEAGPVEGADPLA